MLASLRTKFLLPTFYVFFRVISKKRKSHVFLKSEKKTKNTYSRTLHLTVVCSVEYVGVHMLEDVITRKLSYRKGDRAMRPMYGCPENFQESLTTRPATFPEIFYGLSFRLIL